MQNFTVTGTHIWYYYICKREVWLIAHAINADQRNSNMEIGKYIHETSYERDKKEIELNGMKIDIMKSEKGKLVIGEIKKSSKFMTSARMQLLLYLSELLKEGITAQGVLMIPEERKREEVILDDASLTELENTKKDIMNIITKEKPPNAIKIKYCKNCAYAELCWA